MVRRRGDDVVDDVSIIERRIIYFWFVSRASRAEGNQKISILTAWRVAWNFAVSSEHYNLIIGGMGKA